jgi:hypothetical protein
MHGQARDAELADLGPCLDGATLAPLLLRDLHVSNLVE